MFTTLSRDLALALCFVCSERKKLAFIGFEKLKAVKAAVD